MVPAVPALPVPSSPLSPRKWLKGRPFFHRLIMEVDRKAGHRETEASCQVHRKQHWIVNSSRCQAAAQRLHHFFSLTLFDLNKGLVIPVLKSPAKQGVGRICQKLCVDQNILCVMEKHREITFPYVQLKIKENFSVPSAMWAKTWLFVNRGRFW